MASTKIEILNLALHKIGSERIASLDDENKRAKLLLDIYEITRRSVLESHLWNFATARAEIQAEVEAPCFGYSYQLRIPNDSLRIIEEVNAARFVREGKYLLSNNETLRIKYIRDVKNAGEFSDTFAEALALKLAYSAAYTITQNENLKNTLFQEYNSFMALSRSFSSQEANDYGEADITSFIDVRL